MNDNHEQMSPRRLYRDKEKGVLAGVAAGLADYIGFPVGGMRLLLIVACLFAGPFIVLAYILGALVLNPNPKNLYKNEGEEKFWREVRKSPTATFSNVRYRLRQIDQKLQRMERYVTSPRFDLDRDFRDLERDERRSGNASPENDR